MSKALSKISGADSMLRKKIIRVLARNPRIDGSKLSVAVVNSVVKLDGRVNSTAEKLLAEREALTVPEVKLVRNDVIVLQARPTTDVRLAGEILQCFSLCLGMDLSRVIVRVRRGVTHIWGTVPTIRLKLAAETIARTIPQVIAVVNQLKVTPNQQARMINASKQQV